MAAEVGGGGRGHEDRRGAHLPAQGAKAGKASHPDGTQLRWCVRMPFQQAALWWGPFVWWGWEAGAARRLTQSALTSGVHTPHAHAGAAGLALTEQPLGEGCASVRKIRGAVNQPRRGVMGAGVGGGNGLQQAEGENQQGAAGRVRTAPHPALHVACAAGPPPCRPPHRQSAPGSAG